MIPELELDDVGSAREPRHVVEVVGNNDRRTRRLDSIRVAAVARRFK